MKVVFIVASTILAILITILLVKNSLNKYGSAFEADQQCHADMQNNYVEDSTFGCDHDLETRQWILFNKGVEAAPAIVLERYRY
ncbi:hypothetical protein [Prochlorococcus marinus]|uniref:Uncharacterized protein n=1 Tax=Prochlorococcus marinus (strain MIT 9211) TaxID=93059 RepID=A9BBT9_PROM4|nr:hypothetical protein [Prochlorococcus marinus]ABX09301.1 conserved hypothetical protein [Prochlorococcus marinus str. MIT 9211]